MRSDRSASPRTGISAARASRRRLAPRHGLIEALAMSEALTQTLNYTTRRERPDGSGKNSFPSGHAADTFGFATALERHLNWKYSIVGYVFSSSVAISHLPGKPPLAQ